jgi:predicted nucleotide-binding protein
MGTQRRQRILIVDDDPSFARRTAALLADEGYDTALAYSADEALDRTARSKFDLVLMDIRMHWGSKLNPAETAGEERTGLVLAQKIRRRYSGACLLAYTIAADPAVAEWFQQNGSGVIQKTWEGRQMLRTVTRLLRPGQQRANVFLVHGRDHKTMNQVRVFLRDRLHFEPIVLAEEASLGMSLIDKFEHYASLADVAFVVLTPDDTGYYAAEAGEPRSRPRMNVVFELGYFFKAMRRASGRVIVLQNGAVDLPSDMAGVVTIDISNGVDEAEAEIRRECGPWLSGRSGPA